MLLSISHHHTYLQTAAFLSQLGIMYVTVFGLLATGAQVSLCIALGQTAALVSMSP